MSNQNKNNQGQNQNQQQMPEGNGQGWIVPAVVGVVVVLLIIGGISYARRGAAPAASEQASTDMIATSTDATGNMAASSTETAAMAATSSAGLSVVSSPVTITASPAMSSAPETGYKAYSFERMAEAKAGVKVILFFYSKNSPAAIAIDADIRAHLSAIPSDTLILETLYDESPTLDAWYSIPSAPYFVKIDSKGQPVIGWNSSMTLADILSYAK